MQSITSSITPFTAQDILKTQGIYHFDCQQPLSAVLSQFHSSHDAAFIFDKDDHLLGAVTPSQIFSLRSCHKSTKLKKLAKMPPKLSLKTSLKEIARMMLENKIHFLPVFEKDRFLGITTIYRLLDFIVTRQLFRPTDSILFSENTITLGEENMEVAQAMALMNKAKVSKLPIVDKQGKLIGIVSQFDIRDLVSNTDSVRSDKVGEKVPYRDEPVRDYMKTMITALQHLPTFTQAVNKMTKENIGSILVIDKDRKPMTIVTKHDLLRTIVASANI